MGRETLYLDVLSGEFVAKKAAPGVLGVLRALWGLVPAFMPSLHGPHTPVEDAFPVVRDECAMGTSRMGEGLGDEYVQMRRAGAPSFEFTNHGLNRRLNRLTVEDRLQCCLQCLDCARHLEGLARMVGLTPRNLFISKPGALERARVCFSNCEAWLLNVRGQRAENDIRRHNLIAVCVLLDNLCLLRGVEGVSQDPLDTMREQLEGDDDEGTAVDPQAACDACMCVYDAMVAQARLGAASPAVGARSRSERPSLSHHMTTQKYI